MLDDPIKYGLLAALAIALLVAAVWLGGTLPPAVDPSSVRTGGSVLGDGAGFHLFHDLMTMSLYGGLAHRKLCGDLLV